MVTEGSLTGIVMATLLEAKPFIDGLALYKVEKEPFIIYQNNLFLLIISGIGKVNAAMATTYCLMKFSISSLYNFGASGAAHFNSPLGGIYHISKVIEYDRPTLTTSAPRMYTPAILPGLPTATLATIDSPVHDPIKREEISHHADLIDMEGASILQTCQRFHRQCALFKFVTDTPEHTSHDEIVNNILSCRSSFFNFFLTSILPLIIEV
jgi:adenosylhomocysteine nucleosidase